MTPIDEHLFRRIFPAHSQVPITDRDAPGFVGCTWWIARHQKNMRFIVPAGSAPVPRGGLKKMLTKVSSIPQETLTEDLSLRIEPIGSFADDDDGPLMPGDVFDYGQRVYRGDGFEVVIQGLFGELLDGLEVTGSAAEAPILGVKDGQVMAVVMPLRAGSTRQPGGPPLSLAGATDEKGRAI